MSLVEDEAAGQRNASSDSAHTARYNLLLCDCLLLTGLTLPLRPAGGRRERSSRRRARRRAERGRRFGDARRRRASVEADAPRRRRSRGGVEATAHGIVDESAFFHANG